MCSASMAVYTLRGTLTSPAGASHLRSLNYLPSNRSNKEGGNTRDYIHNPAVPRGEERLQPLCCPMWRPFALQAVNTPLQVSNSHPPPS